ncbi:MAG: C40 family peptidase [Bacteroidetes bacterium]|nr:C40 family peptidase [Bacteroidota bacterium]
MNKNISNSILLGLFVSVALVLSSCHSSQQLVQPSLSRHIADHPRYIDQLSLNGPEKSLVLSSRSLEAQSRSLNPTIGNALQTKYASILSVFPEAICNLSLYNIIDDWYGVRYMLGGTTKAGIDCSAFVQMVYEKVFGINLVRTAIEQYEMTRVLPKIEDCREGDLVFFHTHGRRISHVGIYLMNKFFVHASTSQGIMISSLDDAYWHRKFACAGRVL